MGIKLDKKFQTPPSHRKKILNPSPKIEEEK